MSNFVKVGDKVMWSGAFGSQKPVPAKVVSMEITDEPREKYGEPAKEVSWDLINQNRVLFVLDNGHWAYSDQIGRMS